MRRVAYTSGEAPSMTNNISWNTCILSRQCPAREELEYVSETIPTIIHRGSGCQTGLPADLLHIEDIIAHHEIKLMTTEMPR